MGFVFAASTFAFMTVAPADSLEYGSPPAAFFTAYALLLGDFDGATYFDLTESAPLGTRVWMCSFFVY
jgi:hypothetical protein